MTFPEDISNYTLQELHEAFEGVNDQKYPDRAIELYLRMQELEKSDESLNKGNKFIMFLRYLFYGYYRRGLLRFEARIRQDDLEEKITRVRGLIAQRKNIN